MKLPQGVKNLREQYLAKRTYIKLAEKICAAIQKEMQEACPHPLTIQFAVEHDPGERPPTPPRRICWACGLWEKGELSNDHSCDEDNRRFKLLIVEPLAEIYGTLKSIDRIMATPVENLRGELKRIEKEYISWLRDQGDRRAFPHK